MLITSCLLAKRHAVEGIHLDLIDLGLGKRLVLILPSATMPPKSSNSQSDKAVGLQSRFGRTLKATEKAKDGCEWLVQRVSSIKLPNCCIVVAEGAKRRQAREAKGKQREVASQIESQAQPEPNDDDVIGKYEAWREPSPTGSM